MTRNLETLIQEFNKASEIDRQFRLKGEPYWFEIDGVRTSMVDVWTGELLPEEKAIFEAHIAKVIEDAAKMIGFENSKEWFKDAGQKTFEAMTIATPDKMLSDTKYWIDFDPNQKIN